MGIKDIFTATFTNGQPAVQQQQPAQKEPVLGDSPATTDKNGKIVGSPETQINPLDAYAKMFENAAKSSDIQAPSFKLDPKVLSEVSSSMDFTKSVPQDMIEKALQGDAKALMNVIQSVGRAAYSASLEHTTALTDKYLSQRADYEAQKLNTGVRQQLMSNELSSAPNFDHPVIRAELTRVANQFAAANPDASPQEIAKAAQKYIMDLSSALNPPTNKKQSSKESEGIDWVKYLS